MPSLEVGRVCMKVVGREAGMYCVVLKNVNKSFALITGPKILTGVKRRNSNVNHLEPTQYKIEVSENSSDEDVIKSFEKANLTTKLNLKMPSAAEVKEHMKPKEAKAEEKKEAAKKKETKAKEKK